MKLPPGITNSAGPLRCTPGPGGWSSESLSLRDHRVEQLAQRAETSAHVLLVHVLLLALVAQPEQLVRDVARGKGQHPYRVLPGGVSPDLAGTAVDEAGELPDGLRRRLTADRGLLSEDLDVGALLLGHGAPRVLVPALLNVQPIQLFEDAVDLGQHFLPLLSQAL